MKNKKHFHSGGYYIKDGSIYCTVVVVRRIHIP